MHPKNKFYRKRPCCIVAPVFRRIGEYPFLICSVVNSVLFELFIIIIIIIIIHSFYIALFSALERTHCAYWHVTLIE